MIELSEFKNEGPGLFLEFKDALLGLNNGVIIAIEHIGSTSISNVKAKDIIDVQLSIMSFNQLDKVKEILEPLGFTLLDSKQKDHVPFHEGDFYSAGWEKRLFTGLYKGQNFNIHVRLHGSLNWNFALDFKRYLATNDKARYAFMQFKERLALSGVDRATYSSIKDSVIDLMSLQFKEEL